MRLKVVIGIVLGLGVIFWMAVPNFVNSHRHNPSSSCINFLRLLDSGKQQLALEKQLPPGTVVEAKDVEPFVSRSGQNNFPKCPAGGIYTLNAIGQLPTCSIKGHVLMP